MKYTQKMFLERKEMWLRLWDEKIREPDGKTMEMWLEASHTTHIYCNRATKSRKHLASLAPTNLVNWFYTQVCMNTGTRTPGRQAHVRNMNTKQTYATWTQAHVHDRDTSTCQGRGGCNPNLSRLMEVPAIIWQWGGAWVWRWRHRKCSSRVENWCRD